MPSDKSIAVVVGLIFFIAGVLTLPHYGINWDTINHLPRGQAYLHYFSTGKEDYSDLPAFVPYWQKPESLTIDADMSDREVPGRSLYQSDATTFNWFMQRDGGHPPLSDILSSFFNYIFFQQLGIINDIDAYRIYGIFLAACLVALVFWWTSVNYGKLAGLVAVLSLGTYPVFWSEAHFNTEKDIPEAVFLSLLLFFYWQAFNKRSIIWYLFAGVAFGLALGTKFNVIFSLFIILPWFIGSMLLGYFQGFKKRYIVRDLKLFFFGSALVLLLGIFIFVISWPYLWPDLLSRITEVISYYKVVGTTASINPRFTELFGTNTYPIQWVLYTTPPIVLFFFVLGLISAVVKVVRKKDKFSFLLLLWMAVPILRVTWPGMTIYGGVRQIMEYIPAMAVISGVGAIVIYSLLRSQKFLRTHLKLLSALILLTFIPHFVRLVQIHPNENVYFNFLIGGLSGAKKADLPSWGNSFGAAYRQGVVWLNSNVPPNGKVAFARELMPNIPAIWLRPDIKFHNSYRSGYLQRGEYTIGLTYQGTKDASYYNGYLETFLTPVYEVKVDGVGILKIWKNDKEYLGLDMEEKVLEGAVLTTEENDLTFDLGEAKKLSRLEIEYNERLCNPLKSGIVQLSLDGKNFYQQWGALPGQWRVAALGVQPNEGHFIEPFLGQEAKFIRLVLSPANTCLKNIKDFKVYYFLRL